MYPFHRRRGGPLDQARRVRKNFSKMGFEPRTVQPAANHYIILPHATTSCGRVECPSAILLLLYCDTVPFLKFVFTVVSCFDKESPNISACEIYECLHDSLHTEEGEIDDIKRQVRVLIKFITGQQASSSLHRTNGHVFYENRNVKILTSASVLQASYTAYSLLIYYRKSPLIPLRKLWRNLLHTMTLEMRYVSVIQVKD